MSKTNLKPYLLLITYAGAVFLVVTHLDTIFRQIGWVASVGNAVYHRLCHSLCAQPSL